jgi:acyl-coenzyme A thioesterase PaaI-like protein
MPVFTGMAMSFQTIRNRELSESRPRSAAELEAAGWRQQPDDGFLALVGPVWERQDGDAFRVGFLAEAKHKNRRSVVQGGMLMTFADRAMGLAARRVNDNGPQATVQLDMHFIDAAQIGDFVEAHCEVVRKTSSLVFISGTLFSGNRIIATGNGVWKLLRKANPSA